MQDYRTIVGVIDLRTRGHSYREVQARYGIGSGTVTSLMEKYAACGRTLGELRAMEPADVVELFFPTEKRRRKACGLPDFDAVHRRMVEAGRHADLSAVWLDYKRENPDGYQLSQFYQLYREYLADGDAAGRAEMPVERVPGERLFIDWVGDKPECLLDRATGELKPAHVFATTMGFSSRLYAEAFADEGSASFVAGTVHALEFYGALPKYLVPDNCKTAVRRHTKDELVLSTAYADLEEFYGVVVLPPPPRKPKGKPSVENHVLAVERWVLPRVRGRAFATLTELNGVISEAVSEINAAPFQRKSDIRGSRDEGFERYDRPAMRALPAGRLTTCDYRYFTRVPDNYHLEYDSHYYSVPYTYLGKPAMLKATPGEVRICDGDNRLICSHRRAYKPFPRYITQDDHMPPAHRFSKELGERDGAYYRRWAAAIGPATAEMVDRLLRSYDHEEQGYRACAGVLHACADAPRGTVEEASRACVASNSCRYTYFRRALAQAASRAGGGRGALPGHDNIRGKGCYR